MLCKVLGSVDKKVEPKSKNGFISVGYFSDNENAFESFLTATNASQKARQIMTAVRTAYVRNKGALPFNEQAVINLVKSTDPQIKRYYEALQKQGYCKELGEHLLFDTIPLTDPNVAQNALSELQRTYGPQSDFAKSSVVFPLASQYTFTVQTAQGAKILPGVVFLPVTDIKMFEPHNVPELDFVVLSFANTSEHLPKILLPYKSLEFLYDRATATLTAFFVKIVSDPEQRGFFRTVIEPLRKQLPEKNKTMIDKELSREVTDVAAASIILRHYFNYVRTRLHSATELLENNELLSTYLALGGPDSEKLMFRLCRELFKALVGYEYRPPVDTDIVFIHEIITLSKEPISMQSLRSQFVAKLKQKYQREIPLTPEAFHYMYTKFAAQYMSVKEGHIPEVVSVVVGVDQPIIYTIARARVSAYMQEQFKYVQGQVQDYYDGLFQEQVYASAPQYKLFTRQAITAKADTLIIQKAPLFKALLSHRLVQSVLATASSTLELKRFMKQEKPELALESSLEQLYAREKMRVQQQFFLKAWWDLLFLALAWNKFMRGVAVAEATNKVIALAEKNVVPTAVDAPVLLTEAAITPSTLDKIWDRIPRDIIRKDVDLLLQAEVGKIVSAFVTIDQRVVRNIQIQLQDLCVRVVQSWAKKANLSATDSLYLYVETKVNAIGNQLLAQRRR